MSGKRKEIKKIKVSIKNGQLLFQLPGPKIMGTFEEPKGGPLDSGEEYSNITIWKR